MEKIIIVDPRYKLGYYLGRGWKMRKSTIIKPSLITIIQDYKEIMSAL